MKRNIQKKQQNSYNFRFFDIEFIKSKDPDSHHEWPGLLYNIVVCIKSLFCLKPIFRHIYLTAINSP